MRSRIIWTVVASGLVLIGIGLMHFSLSALAEPSPLETRIANLGKHSVIRLASRHGIPPQPLDTTPSIEAGSEHYGLDCGGLKRRNRVGMAWNYGSLNGR
jgi:hypothetical protein